jgi:steroid delta-isomerase-like uncharacterized protein
VQTSKRHFTPGWFQPSARGDSIHGTFKNSQCLCGVATHDLILIITFYYVCLASRGLIEFVKSVAIMTAESSKLIMRRFVEFINTASEKLAQELISPAAIFHVPGRPEPLHGPDGYLAIIGMMRGAFPDIQWALEEMVAEGDKVAARFTMRGTHQGNFFGVPPTGKKIEVQAMNFYRLSGGQFVEEHGQPDMLGLLQQIGAVPKA